MKNRPLQILVSLTVLSILLATACQALQPVQSPTEATAAQAQATLAPTRAQEEARPTPPPFSSPGVLEACVIDEQAAALKPDNIPNWEALNPGACYDLTLDLDPATSSYSGTAVMTIVNQTGEPLPDLVLRTYPNSDAIYGGSLQIDEVMVNGESVAGEVFLDDVTAYRIPLDAPLAAGEAVEVSLTFEGEITEDFSDLPFVYGVFNHDTSAEFISLANWYPILAQWEQGDWLAEEVVGTGDAVVSESALYRVGINAPEDWALITTGSEINDNLYTSGPVRDFIVLASPNLTELTTKVDGTTIRHWGLPEGQGRWEEALDATTDSVDVFNEAFGDYPYAELDVIAAPLRNALGVEYPGVFLIGDSLYEPNPEREFLLGLVVAHEAAHQWWYGVVGNDVLADPWQDEGLTTFSSTLYQELYQRNYYEGTLAAYQETVDRVETQNSNEDLAIAQPVEAFVDRGYLYSPLVYQKGALFFQTLREELGDEIFFAALQTYYENNLYRRTSPDTLLEAFEIACDCDLRDIYREWGVFTE